MSKFLKIIVNLVVIAAIAVAAALLVPPFAGIDTVMNDNTETDTNLPVGSVAYGRTINSQELEVGDRIIYSEGSSDYVYEITDMDASAGAYRVRDPYNENSDDQSVTIQKSISRVIVVVPFIGYGAIALQSTEGLIVVGLGIVFLIILFILSEIWRKDRDEEEDVDEEEDESEEDSQEEEESDEDEEKVLSRRERRRLKKEEKRRRKLEKKGYLEDEEEEETAAELEENIPETFETETEESGEGDSQIEELDKAMEEAMSSVAMGISQISEPEQVPDATIVMPDIQEIEQTEESPEEVLAKTIETEVPETEPETELEDAQEMDMSENEAEDEIEEPESSEDPGDTIMIPEVEKEERMLNPEAVPNAPSVEELLAKARAAGDAPEVKEDKDNQVTLLDYSDIL